MNSNEETTTNSLNSGNPGFSYDEVFPALPGGFPGAKVQNGPHKLKINSSDITQVLIVPADERKYDHSDKFGEGESVRTCAQISKETGAKIEISTSKDKSLTFLITGKSNSVQEARRKVLTNFQTQANHSINIPKDHHRWILGKSGLRLKELEKSTGTKISIPAISDASDTVTVTGTREGIERAVHEIRVISDEQSKKAFERITVPKHFHPFITGANNEKLIHLSDETNTRINVPPSIVENEEITIAGEKEGVENAKNRILDIYREMEKTTQTVSVEIPKWQHKYLIGHKRQTIAEILQETGVSVEVPPPNVASDTITLRGPTKLLGEALEYVFSKSKSVQSVEIDAPNKYHKLIIGKKGANIRELQDLYNKCHIEFSDDKIRIESSPDSINEIKSKLEEKVYYYVHEYASEEIQVDSKYFKHIIGKSGVNVNRLKNEYDVTITIKDNGANSIMIEGSKGNVAQAKQELEEQIKKLENEKERDIIIEQKLHKMLIGNKREKIKELQDEYKVLIIFPNVAENSNVVKIKGQKNSVDNCHKHLSKIVKELNENSYTMKVPIFKQFHKCIIGKGGSNIKKIRDETGTKIELPSEGEKSDTIIITGKKEKVEQARDRIQQIQNEMANIVTEEVTIPVNLHSALLGISKKLLQAIKDDCGGVVIKFPAQGSQSDKVMVRGPSEDVGKAKQQLVDLVAEKQISNLSTEVRAKPEYHKFLIGKNGLKIKKIRELTGARIIFPNEGDEDKEVITIIGKQESIDKAKQELETMIQQINNTVEQVIDVNPKYHKNFIANRGELIHKISDECGGVIISFPRNMNSNANESKVTVKGNADGVREAIKTIENIVKDLDNKLEDEIQVPPRHHKHFVSRKCEVLQNIIQECGGNDHIVISFPRLDIKDSRVVLKGIKESVLLAKNKIMEIVKDLEEQITIEVVIPNKDHRALIRSRTPPTVDDIRREHNVKISFPDRVSGEGYQQNGTAEMNGHVEDEKEQVKPCDIVYIAGKPENCEAAKQALLEIVPITIELDIPYSYHGSIIGQNGKFIREISNNYEVQINVPNVDLKLDFIKITGRPSSVEEAKIGILKRKKEIDEEREIRELKSYEIKLTVEPEYHPQIIGRGGEIINKIRKDHDVMITLPKKTETDNVITITGFQEKVEKARQEILNIVHRRESLYREEVSIDRRVHSRMIGSKGRLVRKIMEEFGVEIRFPRSTDPNPDTVVIFGEVEKVADCKDHLLNLEEDFLQDVREDVKSVSVADLLDGTDNTRNNKNEAGFVVKNAPWDQKAPDTSSTAEFPLFGNADSNKSFPQLGSDAKTISWGPRR